MKEAEAENAFHYLLDAETEGRIVSLRFYNAQNNKILEIPDSDYKPYFFLPHPMSSADEKEIRNLHGETEVVTKHEFFTNEPKEYTKVSLHSGSHPKS